ncbi:hypothetical protein [Pedobacter endophyticus]|uniref:Uncharacterized protein n=1 Tax=Pedobacter endophyticus TaxID=2789740 RepID=A0A7U3Q540_9SPHI|nr:hypothetical protein [Pedobacter endophyticus]QPH38755.1 hypothetical protein IZT61_17025 [Pedobacter endophyticus]
MKIYLISMLCLLSLELRAQQITVGGVAKINSTRELQPLNSAEMLKKPKGLLNERDVQYLPKANNLYEKDGVYIGLWQVTDGDARRTLEQVQKELEGIYKLVNTIAVIGSEIKTYNNIKYFIINEIDKGEYYYRFFSETHNMRSINGFIKYKKEDKDKAAAILKDLLNNAKFKN